MEWMDTREEMPPINEVVIISIFNGVVELGYWNGRRWHSYNIASSGHLSRDMVYAWQHLPDSYRRYEHE